MPFFLKKWFNKKPAKFAPHASYSQDGEDMIIRSFYEENMTHKGFFVDVGALHPFRFSNTMHFYEKGWRGINIEPTPNAIELFKKYRPNDIDLTLGIGETEQALTFYCFNEPALNTFSKAVAEERCLKPAYKITREIPVKVLPLAKVLDQYLPVGTGIDFMSIDVEGLDLQVLRSNNWNKYRPKYLLVEDPLSDVSKAAQSDICQYLSSLQYLLVAVTLRTLIFKSVT